MAGDADEVRVMPNWAWFLIGAGVGTAATALGVLIFVTLCVFWKHR